MTKYIEPFAKKFRGDEFGNLAPYREGRPHRGQDWHEGHAALKEEAHKRTEQVLVGIRNTYNTSDKDPLTFDEVNNFIPNKTNELKLRLPNITNIVYGRDVGYNIEKIELSPEIQAISATQKRKQLGL